MNLEERYGNNKFMTNVIKMRTAMQAPPVGGVEAPTPATINEDADLDKKAMAELTYALGQVMGMVDVTTITEDQEAELEYYLQLLSVCQTF